MRSNIYRGVDNILTVVDERTNTVHNEDTRAKFYDLPVTVRFYTKGRHEEGMRGFLEGGMALRRVSSIKTSIDTTINSGTTQCCDVTPARPNLRTARGVVAGAGFQLIDELGIRVVPGVRYTRWMGETFKASPTSTQRNQVEVTITLTF